MAPRFPKFRAITISHPPPQNAVGGIPEDVTPLEGHRWIKRSISNLWTLTLTRRTNFHQQCHQAYPNTKISSMKTSGLHFLGLWPSLKRVCLAYANLKSITMCQYSDASIRLAQLFSSIALLTKLINEVGCGASCLSLSKYLWRYSIESARLASTCSSTTLSRT